jgi:hypothetical protein
MRFCPKKPEREGAKKKTIAPLEKLRAGQGLLKKTIAMPWLRAGKSLCAQPMLYEKNPGHWCTQKGMSFCMDPGKMEKIQKIKAVAYTNKEEQRTEKNEDLEVILWQKKKN